VRLGSQIFRLKGIIESDSTLARGGTVFAPRIYVSREGALATGLLKFGSLASHLVYVAPAATQMPEGVIDSVMKLAKTYSWRVISSERALGQIRRTLDFIGTFMSWLTLLIILLGFVMGFYLSQI